MSDHSTGMKTSEMKQDSGLPPINFYNHYNKLVVFNNGKLVNNYHSKNSKNDKNDVQLFPFYINRYMYNRAIPANEDIPVIPGAFFDLCGTKILVGLATGSILGVAMGLFMGSMGDVSPIQVLYGKEVPQAPLREQMRSSYKLVLGKAGSWGRNFGIISALFGGVDCVVEKYRAKHDRWNPVISGCTVGATMGAKAGVLPACMGCAGFAGFGLLIDLVLK